MIITKLCFLRENNEYNFFCYSTESTANDREKAPIMCAKKMKKAPLVGWFSARARRQRPPVDHPSTTRGRLVAAVMAAAAATLLPRKTCPSRDDDGIV